MMVSRRRLLRTGAAALGGTAAFLANPMHAQTPRDPLLPLWSAWTSVHMSSDGRVVDPHQGHGSHSEGQGYAMLLAEAVGDHDNFRRLLDWSEQHLAVRPSDSLFAWRWLPGGKGVIDLNNASDGDLFIAWSLLRASERFGVRAYADRARQIAEQIVELCVKPSPRDKQRVVLLPGTEGFETRGGYIINPAYYMMQAMHDLAAAFDMPELSACAADGSALLSELSRSNLVPDWCAITKQGIESAELKSEDFGYEAMRVPLYLIWSRLPGHSAVRKAGQAYGRLAQTSIQRTATVLDKTSFEPREFSTDPGYRALSALVACTSGGYNRAMMPPFLPTQSYYPATLHLFALVAQREARIDCTT